ncbi:MAG: 2OG-Fe(II) oxygenase [Novosphingobium sp.]|nr:2OG-Fe(II) oxygenase [Novosphingobium sp.]
MTIQGDLFADPPGAAALPATLPANLPEGFALWPDVVSAEQEHALEQAIDAAPLKPFQFGPWEGKRLTAYYGYGYDFGRSRMTEAPPLPAWLESLATRVAELTEQPNDAFVQALVLRYDPGAGIGWHRDRPQFGTVAGLSLTNPVRLRLRRRTAAGFERAAVLLPPRSLYRLEGPARWDWEHSIAPVEAARRSITLRTLRTT